MAVALAMHTFQKSSRHQKSSRLEVFDGIR